MATILCVLFAATLQLMGGRCLVRALVGGSLPGWLVSGLTVYFLPPNAQNLLRAFAATASLFAILLGVLLMAVGLRSI